MDNVFLHVNILYIIFTAGLLFGVFLYILMPVHIVKSEIRDQVKILRELTLINLISLTSSKPLF